MSKKNKKEEKIITEYMDYGLGEEPQVMGKKPVKSKEKKIKVMK